MMKMFRRISILLILFFISLNQLLAQQNQNNIIISGTAIDDVLQSPVEAATAYLSLKKDSSVVDYTITDKEGRFKLEVKKIQEPVFFRVTDDLNGDFFVEFESLTENKDLGKVTLASMINLNEAVISGAPPIRIKSDTLEFNASSFKVRPDANVETLLKQLPGVDIDEDGKITVNGKEVNQILVNGKPFFDKDGKIALQNLPADIINKVQVTDTKTKKEELSGSKASSNNASINLTIDEEKNKGIMFKALAGYGTDDRYESSMMLNYFKGNSRLSILGASNNINSIGFSMNEIFDNMSGGRNNSYWSNSDGSFGMNGISFGGGTGITQSNIGGISYSDTWSKDLEFNGNYFYTDSDSKNNNRTKQQNLLPDNIYTTESQSTTRNQSTNHNFNTSIEVKIDSTSSIWFEPKYTYNKINSSNLFDKFTVNEMGDKLNESNGNTNSESIRQSFSNNINFYKSFKNKTSLSLDFSNSNSRNNSDKVNISNTYFHQTNQPDDIRNQYTRSRNKEDAYNFGIEYEISISDSAKIGVGSNYEIKDISSERYAYDYDSNFGDYNLLNEYLSMKTSSEFNKLTPYAIYKLTKKKFSFTFKAGTQILSQKNNGYYMSNDYYWKQEYTLPFIDIYGNWKFGKNSSVYINYDYDISLPSPGQLLPIVDLSNPLNTVVGNPDLKPTKRHTIYAGVHSYNVQTKTGYGVYMGGNYSEESIVNYRLIDENFVTNTTYKNIKGNYNMWGGMNFNKSFTHNRSKFRIGGGINFNHSYMRGYIDGEQYESRSYSLSPRVNFNWDLGEILSINPSYNLRYQITNYENYRIDESSNYVHTFRLSTTNYWPKNFVFGNDFSYTYNSNIANGFKKDFFLWNTSLAYNFWNKQMSFKVKVYDVLNQNTGDRRTISDTSITDVQNDVLKRYVMFSLGFNLDKFGGGKKRGGSRMMMRH